MIEAIIILGLIPIWFSALVFTILYCIEGKQFTLKVVFGILCFLFTAWLIPLMYEAENKNPCLEYETTMMYNVATKTMMPIRSCKKRGEWVEEKDHE